MSHSYYTRITHSPQGHEIDIHGHVDDSGRDIIRVIGHTLQVAGTRTRPTSQALIGAVQRITGYRTGLRLLESSDDDEQMRRVYTVD